MCFQSSASDNLHDITAYSVGVSVCASVNYVRDMSKHSRRYSKLAIEGPRSEVRRGQEGKKKERIKAGRGRKKGAASQL